MPGDTPDLLAKAASQLQRLADDKVRLVELREAVIELAQSDNQPTREAGKSLGAALALLASISRHSDPGAALSRAAALFRYGLEQLSAALRAELDREASSAQSPILSTSLRQVAEILSAEPESAPNAIEQVQRTIKALRSDAAGEL